jgi:metal-dependent amidase/aminoacylase/carboxypeptidase family protein
MPGSFLLLSRNCLTVVVRRDLLVYPILSFSESNTSSHSAQILARNKIYTEAKYFT